MTADPLAPLLGLPGVSDAAEQTREALGRAHRHRANLRGWPVTAAEASLRAARASSVLDGGAVRIDEDAAANLAEANPVFAGALRVAQELEGGTGTLVGVWRRAPLQALARLHALAAADLVGQAEDGADDYAPLGRPREESMVAARLELVTQLVTGGSAVPAPILAAVVHGELLALKPFGSADGVVARGVARLVTIASGLDPHGLGVPEVYWMRRAADYRAAAAGFAAGTEQGLTDWLLLTCRALQEGAREAEGIADAKEQAGR